MRVLLDEDLPWQLRHYFPDHEVFTTAYMGWKSKGNGELLALARDEFDAFITIDQRLDGRQAPGLQAGLRPAAGRVVTRPGTGRTA